MNRDLAIIDADHVAFRCAASAEHETSEIACARADQLMKRILLDLNDPDYELYLGGEGNFRYKLYPEYKANRIGKYLPRYLQDIREYLVKYWGAKIVNDMEADDMCSIRMAEEFHVGV